MIFRFLNLILILFLTIFSAQNVFAYRPFTTEDVGTVAPNVYEFEFGHDYVEVGDGERSGTAVFALITGLNESIQIGAKLPVTYYLDAGADIKSGFGDVALESKVVLKEETDALPGLGLFFAAGLPSGDFDRGLGEAKAGYTFLGLATRDWGHCLLHANAGVEFVNDDKDLFLASFGFDHGLTDSIRWVAEVDWATDFDSGSQNERLGFMLGGLYHASESLVWDLGVRYGTMSEEDNLTVTCGVTLLFGGA